MKDAAGRMLAIVNDRDNDGLADSHLAADREKPQLPRRAQARDKVIRSLIAERRAMDEATWPDDLLSRMVKPRRGDRAKR